MSENQMDRGGYIEAVGRRKNAVARVRISKLIKKTVVNGKPIESYFPTEYLTQTALRPKGEKEEFATDSRDGCCERRRYLSTSAGDLSWTDTRTCSA